MEVTKTVRAPVHYALTKRKLGILDHLTARHSYCVWLFSKLIGERNMNVNGYGEFTRPDIAEVRRLTKLNIAYVQQCRDQALWMWRSYHAQHEDWEHQLKYAKGKWREKLQNREPQRPFREGLAKRVPVRVDIRTGRVEQSKHMKLTPFVLRLSTLRKHHRMIIPLNLAEYHLDLLRKGRIVDFQLIKRDSWYYAHICVKYDVPGVPVHGVRGVDLGVRRAMATVLLKPNRPIRRGDLSILKDGERKHRLDLLNRRIAGLQQAKRWEPLKRLRHKRTNLAEYHDRLAALRIAEMATRERSGVAVGCPQGIKYENYKGNGKRSLRRILQQRFPYRRRIQHILEECAERGVKAEPVLEAWTSQRCHRCGSMNTHRPSQSLFWCHECALQYNADWNAAMNIGSVFLPVALSRRAREGLAHAGDELAHKRVSPEAEIRPLASPRQLH